MKFPQVMVNIKPNHLIGKQVRQRSRQVWGPPPKSSITQLPFKIDESPPSPTKRNSNNTHESNQL